MRRLLLIALVALLTACAAADPVPEPRPSSEVVPVVSSAQLDGILERILAGVADADTTRDAAKLAAVADGPALVMRSAAYTLATKNPQLQQITPLGGQRLQDVVPAAQDWPRTVLVVTRTAEDDQVPELLLLTQRGPREQYKLTAYASMIGGATLPLTQPLRDGVPLPRRADASGLLLSAQETVDLYARLLTAGPTVPGADQFSPSPMTDAILKAQADLTNTLTVACAACFTVSVTHVPTGQLWAFGTQDGGALVLAELRQETTLTSQQGYQTTLGPEHQAITGVERINTKGTFTRNEMFAFAVPPKGPRAGVQVVAGTLITVSGTAG